MPLFLKADARSVHSIQLTNFIAESGLKPRTVMWKCNGKCHVLGDPAASMSKHILYEFPSGMLWYTCLKCGAGAIFESVDDRDIATITDKKERITARNNYKEFTDKVDKEMSKAKNTAKKIRDKSRKKVIK